jgi:hypothetical protein
MNSSISKLNRDERSLLTDKNEYCGIKQADKDRESQEIPRHPMAGYRITPVLVFWT